MSCRETGRPLREAKPGHLEEGIDTSPPASPSRPRGDRTAARQLVLVLMLLALIGMRMVNFMLSDESVVLRGEENGTKPAASRLASSTPGLAAAFRLLRSNRNVKYVIVDAKNGLANRLRALASGMSVAAALGVTRQREKRTVIIIVVQSRATCHFVLRSPREKLLILMS